MASQTSTNTFSPKSKLSRAALGLPFLALFLWCLMSMHGDEENSIAPFLDEFVQAKKLEFDSTISVPILEKFHHVKPVDDLWRLATVAFAPSTLGVDLVTWFQMLSFLVDFSLLYLIWLFESTGRADSWTPVKYPLLFGLAAQVLGAGVLAPLYYFLHITTSNVRLANFQYNDAIHEKMIFLIMTIFSYIPIFLMYLGPSPAIRHFWTWAWQMFPLWVSLTQALLKRVPTSRKNNSGNSISLQGHLATVRATVGIFAMVSGAVWVYLLLCSPYSITTIFFPFPVAEHTFLPILRRYLQCDHISAMGSSLLWLLYLFSDLKSSGLVKQSWVLLFGLGCLTTACFGPGFALAAGWMWREELLTQREIYDRYDKKN